MENDITLSIGRAVSIAYRLGIHIEYGFEHQLFMTHLSVARFSWMDERESNFCLR